MTERSRFMMAALASAAMPTATIAGTRDSEQVNATDKGYGNDHAVVRAAAGKLNDPFASGGGGGGRSLRTRRRDASGSLVACVPRRR